MQTVIERKIKQALAPTDLWVVNESHRHHVPSNASTHFKVTVVSSVFVGQSLVKRHRMVYRLLSEELAGSVHALALHTYTPDEWVKHQASTPDSPICLGGG